MQWYETPEGQKRLQWECYFLGEDYPGMRVDRCEDQYIRVSGILGPSNLSERTMFIVAEFPSIYPNSRPRVFAPEENFPTWTPHLYPNSSIELCVEHNDFTPDDTMSTVLSWTLAWIAVYDEFVKTGKRW